MVVATSNSIKLNYAKAYATTSHNTNRSQNSKQIPMPQTESHENN